MLVSATALLLLRCSASEASAPPCGGQRDAPGRPIARKYDPATFLLAQLSDSHLGADWGGCDPVAALAVAVESVRGLRPRPEAVLVSGDLAANAAADEYEQARALLTSLEAPLFVLPGNHDDRAALRRHFAVPGADGEPVQYAADVGGLRLVAVDTTRPGEDPGTLDEERLSWLDTELAGEPDAPTVIAMHHPPLVTGIPALDETGLPAADRRALAAVVERHAQVRRIVAGHVHRPITGDLAGCAVLAAPSTYMQARLDLHSAELQLVPEPAGFVLHVLRDDGELVSHVQTVERQ
jgi:3',5'-cyclic-AMP phosphodiesterase